jgi:hypothetical protein
MRSVQLMIGLATLSLTFGAGAPRQAEAQSTQEQSCQDRAGQGALAGDAKSKFLAACKEGALPPPPGVAHAPQTPQEKALVAPGGTPRHRSRACNAEAARRGLKEQKLQYFRKACLASAAPVSAIETQTRATTPSKAKPKLDALTDAPKAQ